MNATMRDEFAGQTLPSGSDPLPWFRQPGDAPPGGSAIPEQSNDYVSGYAEGYRDGIAGRRATSFAKPAAAPVVDPDAEPGMPLPEGLARFRVRSSRDASVPMTTLLAACGTDAIAEYVRRYDLDSSRHSWNVERLD